MEATEIQKELMRSKVDATFDHYCAGNLFYNVILNGDTYQFAVPTIEKVTEHYIADMGDYSTGRTRDAGIKLSEDLGSTNFDSTVKGTFLWRWIRKSIDKGEFTKLF